MVDGVCKRCAGFGVIARGVDMSRCNKDWSLLFTTPAGQWMPCPDCRVMTGKRAVLDLVARLAYRRVTGTTAANPWQTTTNGWQRRRLDGQFIYRWRYLCVAPPGPAFGSGWTLLEPDGVLRRQHFQQVRHLLRRAGAPELPE
jgi:hypothetical protein